MCNKMIWSAFDRIYLFRADTAYHYVTPIEEGNRWILSFGLRLRK